jgi:dTDP-4-amino-4,6-dideoxygalactose transaminase
MINVFQPNLGNEELEMISSVFQSNWTGKGKINNQFETELAHKFNTSREHFVSVNSCTKGMFSIFKQILNEGDEVILPSISFVGAANAILDSKGVLKFCDVDYRTLNPTIDDIIKKYTPKTKAVIIIHYGGYPMHDMLKLVEFCIDKKIYLIEDNACSPFSKINNVSCGTIGDYGVWSFDSMKILVTGDGGLIYGKDLDSLKHIEKYLFFGLKTKSGLSNNVNDRWWEFDIECAGENSIMNDISSAIGVAQLKKIDSFLAKRKEITELYTNEFKNLDWLKTIPELRSGNESSYYFYWVQTEFRDELAKYLKSKDIYTTFRYYPLHLVPYYRYNNNDLPIAEKVAAETLCIPLHQSLSENETQQVIDAIKAFK